MSICKSCGATIEFVETRTGKQMPMDVEASPCPTCKGTGIISVMEKDWPCGKCNGKGEQIKTHFSTCPTAAQHRRKP